MVESRSACFVRNDSRSFLAEGVVIVKLNV